MNIKQLGTLRLQGNDFYHALYEANEWDKSIGATHRIGTWKYLPAHPLFWTRPVIVKKSVVVFLEDSEAENPVWEAKGERLAHINLWEVK